MIADKLVVNAIRGSAPPTVRGRGAPFGRAPCASRKESETQCLQNKCNRSRLTPEAENLPFLGFGRPHLDQLVSAEMMPL